MLDLARETTALSCARCGTELAALALACPMCSALVHRERLEQLAALADAASQTDRELARTHWQEALSLVPIQSQQFQQISARIAALTDTPPTEWPASGGRRWWSGAIGVAATVLMLLAGKLKFLLLGLSKLSTVVSMFGFIGVYWTMHGWPLAIGIAVSIYIHEMGHVAMLRKLGIHANAPLFIPGIGAVVMLKRHISDPVIDARIGLAGPVWGLGAPRPPPGSLTSCWERRSGSRSPKYPDSSISSI